VLSFTTKIEAVHGEVHSVAKPEWPERLLTLLANRGVKRLLISPTHPVGQALQQAWANSPTAPELIPYDRSIEDMKDTLVHSVDAAITSTVGAIAETGSLVLKPTGDEPRLMSLLPPIHIALLEEGAIHDTLQTMMSEQGWNQDMPTNLLLISGPSKTADIEQTLAYGVHGPKELIVLILK
jgi:L-lactate dehydrogenase complex protein LldG